MDLFPLRPQIRKQSKTKRKERKIVIRKRVKVWFGLWCLTKISLVEETGVPGENH
jgi:hypothetical protein